MNTLYELDIIELGERVARDLMFYDGLRLRTYLETKEVNFGFH
jgi:hypothetical protein